MQFYESETLLVDCVTSFLATGDDVSAARRDGIYVTRGAAQTLSTFMVDGAPDPHRFSDAIGELWNELGGQQPFLLLYTYPAQPFLGALGEQAFREVCSGTQR